MTKEWASKRVQGSAERDISLEIEEGICFCPFFWIFDLVHINMRSMKITENESLSGTTGREATDPLQFISERHRRDLMNIT